MVILVSLPKRLIVMVYELLLLIGLWFVTTGFFVLLFGEARYGSSRYLLQITLWLTTGMYFVWHWQKYGQTLPMKTWKIQLADSSGQPLPVKRAGLRYILATLSLCGLGLGFLWALFDKERQFLHDRLLNSRIIAVPPQTAG